VRRSRLTSSVMVVAGRLYHCLPALSGGGGLFFLAYLEACFVSGWGTLVREERLKVVVVVLVGRPEDLLEFMFLALVSGNCSDGRHVRLLLLFVVVWMCLSAGSLSSSSSSSSSSLLLLWSSVCLLLSLPLCKAANILLARRSMNDGSVGK